MLLYKWRLFKRFQHCTPRCNTALQEMPQPAGMTGGCSAPFNTQTIIFKLGLSHVSLSVSYFIDSSRVKVINW
jgi:hypothetical protein